MLRSSSNGPDGRLQMPVLAQLSAFVDLFLDAQRCGGSSGQAFSTSASKGLGGGSKEEVGFFRYPTEKHRTRQLIRSGSNFEVDIIVILVLRMKTKWLRGLSGLVIRGVSMCECVDNGYSQFLTWLDW